MERKWLSVVLRILAHLGVVVTLYIAFSFSLFLGLQVRPLFGNVGLITCVILVVLYVYYGWIKPITRTRSHKSSES